jgi:hypothetical protein
MAAAAKFFYFSQLRVDLKLDTHRFIGNNTHELIVLPAFRQVLPAKRFGLRQRVNSNAVR